MDRSTHPTAAQIITTTYSNLSGIVILLTGASSGLGLSSARALADTKATLFLGVRDIPKAQNALSDILDGRRIQLLRLDLARLTSVRSAAAGFTRQSAKLHILINNGEVMMTPDGMTSEEGDEVQIGTNHLTTFCRLPC